MKEANDKTLGKFIDDARFTLLEISWKPKTENEVLARENFWKNALGSRAHGLNAN